MKSSKIIVEEYTKKQDWRVKENSTVTYSVGGLILNVSGATTADYWLSEIYDNEISNAHRNADIHIHDLSMLTGYCAGWSLKQLIQQGLGGVEGKITSSPASHLSTLCNQMVNFLGIMQNEWAGAQAFSSFDTYLAPFVKTDNLNYKQVKQCIQSFVYGVNTPSRWGTQAPFTNVTLDWTCPPDLAEQQAIVAGKEQSFKYKDCKAEMDMINKAFIEIMVEGDYNGRGFQYPIPTYSITKDFDWSESENNKLLFEMTAKYGTPYFSNYINSDMEPSQVRSMAFLGTQKIIYQKENGTISNNEISDLVDNWLKAENKPKYKILMNGSFVDCTEMFKIDYKDYKNYTQIELDNGYIQSFSTDHKCAVLSNNKIETKLSQFINKDDNFLLSANPWGVNNNIGTYESGKMIGYYLAEGWKAHEQELNFAININHEEIVDEICKFFSEIGCRTKIDKQNDNNIFKVFVYGKQAKSFIEQFIRGNTAKEKRLSNNVWNTDDVFRQGIFDGYLVTDGCLSHNIFAHTTNKKLCDDLIVLASSIGKIFKYRVNNKNTRYFKGNPDEKESFTSYELKIKEYPKTEDGQFYIVPVRENKLIPNTKTNYVYNFTVNTPEHLFELPNGIISHQCCRLRLDLRELSKKGGGFFGSGESTGSIGVVTINLPKIAYLSKNESEFYEKLDKLMDISARSLDIKRKTITELMNCGLYPYTKHYLRTFNNHFSTIGLIGMNEVGLNARWIRKNISENEMHSFAVDILNHMRERLVIYQEKYNALFNLEATPAESTTYRLAKHDKELYPDIITAGNDNDTPYYTNSSHLPVGYTDDVFEALENQDDLQALYTSGTVFHAFLGEKLPSWEVTANLVKKIAENYKLPYFTISPTYSVCKNHGYITGEHFNCPVCGKEAEVYSRITGYYRPVKNWNEGKSQEYKNRKEYVVENGIEETKSMLFTTPTCPNCNIVKSNLDNIKYDYEVMDATKNEDLVTKFDIMQAPTLVIENSNGEVEKYAGIIEINQYVDRKQGCIK